MQHLPNFCGQHIDRDFVFPAFRNNNVSPSFAWLNELEMHRFYGVFVLSHDRLNRAVTLEEISPQSTQQPFISISLDEDFDIHEIAKLPVIKYQNALYDDHILRLNYFHVRKPMVCRIVIEWLVDWVPFFQLLEMFDKKRCLKCVGMIKIDLIDLKPVEI